MQVWGQLPLHFFMNSQMTFLNAYLLALLAIVIMMTILWIVSVIIKNVSIVDLFWGFGFVLSSSLYFILSDGNLTRKILVMTIVTIWGLRLSIYLAWRNKDKGEDFRYREFRMKYGEKRYWWISYFQTFLLQGILMWLISAPLLGAQFFGTDKPVGILDYIGLGLWIIGILFEAGGDFQLAIFKANPLNKGKVLNTGFWRYTRHPNYFGDSAVWWGFGSFCLAAGSYSPALGSVLMTSMIIKVSGVALLEKSLKEQKPEYKEYIEKTSAFLPWFPKK
jgi:steroid 5-alpha reductase family enzyme